LASWLISRINPINEIKDRARSLIGIFPDEKFLMDAPSRLGLLVISSSQFGSLLIRSVLELVRINASRGLSTNKAVGAKCRFARESEKEYKEKVRLPMGLGTVIATVGLNRKRARREWRRRRTKRRKPSRGRVEVESCESNPAGFPSSASSSAVDDDDKDQDDDDDDDDDDGEGWL